MIRTALIAASLIAQAAFFSSAPAQAFPTLDVSPNWVRFQNVTVGTARSIRLLVRNTGTEPLFAIRVNGFGATRPYLLTNSCSYLSQYATCIVNVRFRPEKAGNYNMTLEVSAGAAFGRVQFQGTAAEPSAIEAPIEPDAAGVSEARK